MLEEKEIDTNKLKEFTNGNFGGINIINRLIKNGISSDNIYMVFTSLGFKNKGDKIWCLYKDVCGQDFNRLKKLIEDMSILSEEDIRNKKEPISRLNNEERVIIEYISEIL